MTLKALHVLSCPVVFALYVLLPSRVVAFESALDEQPYVYARFGTLRPSSLSIETETGYGTRNTRLAGDRGFEQGLRLRYQPTERLGLETYSGLLVAPDADSAIETGLNVYGTVVRQDMLGADLHVSGGYAYDYRSDHLLRFGAMLSRSFGNARVMSTAVVEVPLTGKRDEADVILGLGGTYSVTQHYSQGLELNLEDLEGLWEEGETEGGAKLVAGPTAYFDFPRGFYLKINASLVALLPGATSSGDAGLRGRLGFMARLTIAYLFDLAAN